MSTERGQAAETEAANHLVRQGYRILERNWRNRWCEIDIVALKDDNIHAVEVKYRHRADYGSGFDAVNYAKRQRLIRAAQAYAAYRQFNGTIFIDVVSVSGEIGSLAVDYLENAVS
jgi:putative endonuclease